MTEQPTIMVTIPTPPSLNKLWVTAPGKPRVRSAEYRAWAEDCAGFQLLKNCRSSAWRRWPAASISISKCRSHDATRATTKRPCATCARVCGVVTNDGNAHRITVTPTNRTDCLLAFTPLPAMDGVRKQVAPRRAGRMSPVKSKGKRAALTWKLPA